MEVGESRIYISSVGVFKNSTINALRDVLDEDGSDCFPSPSMVN
jgi:hypothetical protein